MRQLKSHILCSGQHEMIAENLSTAVVSDLNQLVKSLKDDRRKVGRFLLSVRKPTRAKPPAPAPGLKV